MVVCLQYSSHINLVERLSVNLCGRGLCYENSSVDGKLFIRFQWKDTSFNADHFRKTDWKQILKGHRSTNISINGLNQLNRELKKTTSATAMATSLNKRFMSGTMAVHVHYNSWYISLPFSANQQREMIKLENFLVARCFFINYFFQYHRVKAPDLVRSGPYHF